jgi:hypothetical protein
MIPDWARLNLGQHNSAPTPARCPRRGRAKSGSPRKSIRSIRCSEGTRPHGPDRQKPPPRSRSRVVRHRARPVRDAVLNPAAQSAQTKEGNGESPGRMAGNGGRGICGAVSGMHPSYRGHPSSASQRCGPSAEPWLRGSRPATVFSLYNGTAWADVGRRLRDCIDSQRPLNHS